jgi:iron complex transport system substrate-binding protein
MVSREDAKIAADAEIERLARIVVNCGFHLHRDLGPGLLESAYEILLRELLLEQGLTVRCQVSVPIRYRHIVIDNAFKIDLLVEDRLVIELKSVEKLVPVHGKQLLTYLRLMNAPLGLLKNFGQAMFRDGVQRIVNRHTGTIGQS